MSAKFAAELHGFLFDVSDHDDVELFETALSDPGEMGNRRGRDVKTKGRDVRTSLLTEAYEVLLPVQGCEFCLEVALECDCEDVELGEDVDLDTSLVNTSLSFEVVAKLGRVHTEQLLGELSLDADDETSWKILESMTRWL